MNAYTTARISIPLQPANPNLKVAFGSVPVQPISFFPAGSEIYAQGEKAGAFYQVEFGAVRVYRLLADGRRQISAFHLPGETFGFEADTTHHFFAEAINATGVRVFRTAARADMSQQLLPLALKGLTRAQE
ncbi:MAG: cyclic nucleotide-binding domain-containing protein, partial [Mesorhizobium sp.]